jgi:hypothetical protein
VFVCKFCGKKQNLDINVSRNILKRSSYKNGGIYISKSKILDELVNLFIERYKRVNSCPLILTNPYFLCGEVGIEPFLYFSIEMGTIVKTINNITFIVFTSIFTRIESNRI